MSKISKKAKFVVAGAVALTMIGGGVAFAYWSTTGEGSGSATSSNGASDLTISQTNAPSGLAPSVAPVDVTGSITNNAPNSAYVNQLTVEITGVDAGHPGCSAADFGLTTGSSPLSKLGATQTLTRPVTTELASGGSVSFPAFKIGFANDPSASQDACKGALPQLKFTTN
ncbi:hypothetical protein [Actinophytocola sp.]|uniref:hypothetical protein n=1 Tax=Actinophytocola sp. TaxID=1872138 RepID=UPI002ED52076